MLIDVYCKGVLPRLLQINISAFLVDSAHEYICLKSRDIFNQAFPQGRVHVYWRSLLGSYLFMHNFPNHIYLETQIFRQYISKLSDLINDCNGNAELYKHFINCDGRICSI